MEGQRVFNGQRLFDCQRGLTTDIACVSAKGSVSDPNCQKVLITQVNYEEYLSVSFSLPSSLLLKKLIVF